MIKLSIALAVIGCALLALSFVPGSAIPAAPAVAPTVAPADAAYGRALFVGKGCAMCHHHAALAGSGPVSGPDVPDLTEYRWDESYLRAWIADPTAVRPNTRMPNLGLAPDEIEAIIAFLKHPE